MPQPRDPRRPDIVRADASRGLQADLFRYRVRRRQRAEGDEERHHAGAGALSGRGVRRGRNQGGRLFHGRLPRRDHRLLDPEHQLLQQPSARLRQLHQRLPPARHRLLRSRPRAPPERRVAQGPAQPPPFQHGLLREQTACCDSQGRDPAPAEQDESAAGLESFRARHQPTATRSSLTAALAALVMMCGCSHASATPRAEHPFPKVGVILLSLATGTVKATASVGGDLVAVTLSEDGENAYVADSAPGDVYALTMPALTVVWKQHVGGSPFGLLLHGGRLLVSLFAGAAVVALDPVNGAQMAL